MSIKKEELCHHDIPETRMTVSPVKTAFHNETHSRNDGAVQVLPVGFEFYPYVESSWFLITPYFPLFV